MSDKKKMTVRELESIKKIVKSQDIKMPKGYVSNSIFDKWQKELDGKLNAHKNFAKAGMFGGQEVGVPQQRTSLSAETSHDDLLEWLSVPEDNKENLLNLSRKFYFTISKYAMAVNYYQTLLTLDSFLIPKFESYENLTIEDIKADRSEVDAFCEGILNKSTSRNMLKAIVRDGGYYAVIRDEGEIPFLQRLPNSHSRSQVLVNGEHGLEFNFSYFEGNEDKLETFPKYFETMFRAFQKDSNLQWQVLEPEVSIAIPSEAEDIDVPFLIAMFRDMLELDDYYTYMKQSIQSEIDKLIVQKIPMDEETGEMLVSPDFVQLYNQIVADVIDSRYSVITTPFEIDEVNFKVGKGNDSGFSGLDTMEKKVSEGSGISPAIFRENSATALKANHNASISFMYAYVEKIELWANRRLRERATSLGYYKIKILPTTMSNRSEFEDMFTNMVNYGGSIAPLVAVSGIDANDYTDMLEFENALAIKDLLIPPSTAHTGGGEDKGGRPESDVDDLSDEGVITRDTDGNED